MMNLRVKEICKERGLSIGELALRMNIKRESLSRAINGNPTVETLEKIAQSLDVPVSDLFSDNKTGVSVFTCPNCGTQLEVNKR